MPSVKNNKSKVSQRGGGASDFANLWHSWEVSPAELSRITLEKIDCAPMFNPLRKGTVIPTGTSGIIPTGVYLAALPPLVDSCSTVECFNRGQVGLVTDAQQVAVANQQATNQQFVNQLSAQEGLPQQTGNSLINSLAQFMGMNSNGVSQTGSGTVKAKGTQAGGNSKTIKYVPMTGGCCQTCNSKQVANQNSNCVPFRRNNIIGKTSHFNPNQTQQGGTLSNGLGYSPFKGSQWTATSCANSCVPFNNTCGGRQPVYYSETESREGCTTRCRMAPGTYATSDLGCRSTAFANRDIDYGTYEDLHGTNLAANAASLPQPCVKRPEAI